MIDQVNLDPKQSLCCLGGITARGFVHLKNGDEEESNFERPERVLMKYIHIIICKKPRRFVNTQHQTSMYGSARKVDAHMYQAIVL